MTQVEAEAEIPLPAAEYWSIRNTQEFFDIECRVLNNASKRLLEEEFDENGTATKVRLATKPDISFVPSYLLNMLPGDDKSIIFYDDVEYVYDDPLTPYAFRYAGEYSFIAKGPVYFVAVAFLDVVCCKAIIGPDIAQRATVHHWQ